MSNSTDPLASSVHGLNPQNIVGKILRNRIYASVYWKEDCFGLTAETLVDKAIELSYIGGSYAGNQKPTPFICLLLKMLQLQPEEEIVFEFISNDEYKYVTALGLFYYRLTARAEEIYKVLEPFYSDYRKLRLRRVMDWEIINMDDFVDKMLTEEYVCDIAMPRLQNRFKMELIGALDPRKSVLEEALEDEDDEEDN